MYVTGGITNKGYSSEVWKYNLDTKQWQQGQVTTFIFSANTFPFIAMLKKEPKYVDIVLSKFRRPLALTQYPDGFKQKFCSISVAKTRPS
jgi:hypothetical protein